MNEKIESHVKRALEHEVFRDAEILVAKDGEILWHQQWGLAQKKALFDLSSLTKPIVVGSLVFQGLAKRKLHLRKQIQSYFKSRNLDENTILDLLDHKSGLIAHKVFLPVQVKKKSPTFRRNAQFIFRKIVDDTVLKRKQSSQTVYSDLGYIVLGRILEKIYNAPLNDIFYKKITKPLGVEKTLLYRPLSRTEPLSDVDGFVPSGFCIKRERLLQGEVQDSNAYVMGGVSGHAGLFGDALSLHKFLNEWRLSQNNRSKIFDKDSYDLLMKHLHHPYHHDERRFVLGFETISDESRNFGTAFSQKHSVCHLGYSGVSFVWETQLNAWVIVLTNRGIFGLDNPKIYDFRKKLHMLISKEIQK